MKRVHKGLVTSTVVLFVSLTLSTAGYSTPPTPLDLNTAKIEALSGVKGQINSKDATYKITAPRSDLKITVNGVQITPAMGLTSWMTFKKVGSDVLMIGDLILTPDQIKPVLGVALNNGLQVTSLHNSYLWESPQVVTMHIEATSTEGKLASAAGQLLETIKSTSQGQGVLPLAILDPTQTTLDPNKISSILGRHGTLKDGVYKVVINEAAETDDYQMNGSMGLNTWATFIGSNTEAVVNGDLVVEQSNLQKILLTLQKTGIYVVGIQDHTADTDPKFVSVSFWGVGNTQHLAKGIKTALDLQQSTND